MQIRPHILLIAAGVLIAFALPSLIYHKTRFRPVLNDAERAVEKFSPATLTITRKVWQDVPVSLPVTPPPPPAVPAAIVAPSPRPQPGNAGKIAPSQPVQLVPSKPRVSLIVADGSGNGKAIIDGIPLKVGEQLREWTVERIETSRVLLRGRKGTIWVSQD